MEPTNPPPDLLDALRVQAAAVAAQQAALTEEELRLQQRRGALEKQEAQLAAHLDDRRRRLLELKDEINKERADLLDDLHREKESVVRERQHLEQLRERQKQRWRDHWRRHEAALKRREEELNAEREQVRQQVGALEHERTIFELGRLKLNGELEINRRELQEDRHELGLAQQHWHEAINLEQADRQRRETALAAREAATAQTEQALVEQKQLWERGREARQQELDGLDMRIRHARSQLPPAREIVSPVPAVHRIVAAPDVPPTLHRLADEVADQRWRLLEQWQHMLEVHHSWDKEKTDIARALEATALQFIDRDHQLAAGERKLEEHLSAAHRQHDLLREQRLRLEARQAQLAAQEAGWESERAALLAEMQARTESVVALTQQMETVRLRREHRRRQDIEQVRTVRVRCEEMRRQYVTLWQDVEERRTALTRREREFDGQRLALARYRVEYLSRSSNPAAAEKRVDRLVQRIANRFAAAQRESAKQHDALVAETARLDERAEQLRRLQEELDQRCQDLTQRETAWETRQLEQAAAEQKRAREQRQLQLRREYDEAQLSALRDEVERVARLLIDDESAEPLSRAA